MKLGDHESHERLHRWEPLDRIDLQVVPRYKTSGMSGDEWRISVLVRGYFKGMEVFSFGAGNMRSAVAMLPGKILEWADTGLEIDFLGHERKRCDQPSCSNDAVNRYRMKRLTDECGQWLDMAHQPFVHYRQFCAPHSKRGDCSREDADDNYELMAGPGADAVPKECVTESEVVFVDVDSPEQIGDAVREVRRRGGRTD